MPEALIDYDDVTMTIRIRSVWGRLSFAWRMVLLGEVRSSAVWSAKD